jgi:peptidoglycan-associated lipoprotein
LKGDVNGRFHDGPAAFSSDGRTMYFTRSDYYKFRLNKDGSSVSHLKLFRAELNGQEWGNIHQFAYNGEDFSTGHAALSTDGSKLYFISDRPGGNGGTDLYYCDRTAEGWSEPINLGSILNTPGNEMFPTVHGDTLLFASNGHAGLGGLDIFRTWKENGEWVKPLNMNYPLNSTSDDLSLVFNSDGRSGFLSSNRTGRDMIHSFMVNEPILVLHGRCIDYNTSVPVGNVLVKLTDVATKETRTTTTDLQGEFVMELLPGLDIELQTNKEGWLTETVTLSTIGQRTSKNYEVDIAMIPIEVDKPVVVNNIYYDYDRWDIRPDAAIELMKLARLFKENPDHHFELSSHTDSRASNTYNLLLSEARAKSAVDFLIRQGVDPQRLKAKGYGESQLVNHCGNNVNCSEDLHQQNRRTEFKIVRPEVVISQ